MSDRPRKGHRVAFTREDGIDPAAPHDPVAGLRFTIVPQHGAPALIDYTGLRPRRLALTFARALRRLAAPGGPLSVRSTVKAYATTHPRFFSYLRTIDECIAGVEDLRACHIDGFEAWLEAEGLSRTHLFTVLAKIVTTLRSADADAPGTLAPDLLERLRYVSAKPFQRSSPRDALSPFVARQLRDAARADVERLFRRIGAPLEECGDDAYRRALDKVDAIITEHGGIAHKHHVYMSLYFMRARRGLPISSLSDDLHGRHHLLASDLPPLLTLLSLETGLEIECLKALTVDCLRNVSAQTVEVAYMKRRARGTEHKTIRVRDGGVRTPGGLIRCVIEVTAAARRIVPSDCIWIYRCEGELRAGIRQPRETLDTWTERHGIVDDEGRPLRLLLSQLRKTHKALWYLKTEGHMTRFAVGHTVDVAARHYADLPSLRPLHEATIAAAFEDALAVATGPHVLAAEAEAAWLADPDAAPDLPGTDDIGELLDGSQDVWLASCGGFYASPFGTAGSPCPTPFWGCLECANAVITARKLPAILAFLVFIEEQRASLSAGDWAAKFGRAHARITTHILPAFSDEVIADARDRLAVDPPLTYLPPEVRA
ncbi:MAG TPA: hypothetical protein VKM54_07885 [Myxococcota bacterium]|nr:hypothetical protein [Myxococcota bacterium]